MAEQELTAVVDEEQTDPSLQQTDEAVGEDVQAAEPANGAEFDYSQINEEWLKNALERSEVVKNRLKQEQDNGFNAGKQHRDKELRLERGNEDTARAYSKWVAEQIANGVDPEEFSKQTPLYVKANRDVERVNAAKAIIEDVAEVFSEDDQARIDAVVEAIADDPDQMRKLARELRNTAADRLSSKQIAELTLDRVPKDSALHKSIQEHIAAEATKEIEAKQMEQNQKQNPPRTSTGGAAGDPLASLARLDSASRIKELVGNDELREAAWDRVQLS